MNKLIAISTGTKSVDMAPGNISCAVLNNDFIKLCNGFGNTAVVIGPQENLSSIDISKFDALIISGGGDINPKYYGEKIGEKTIRINDERDETELMLLQSAEDNNIKTLAICRGQQLLNVYKGGNLYQDLNDSGFIKINHEKPFENARSHVHSVTLDKKSKIYNLIGIDNFEVNSIHHQAIKNVGKDLSVSAKSPDGVIEGIETTTTWEALGIQWHPENMLEDEITNKLFTWINN